MSRRALVVKRNVGTGTPTRANLGHKIVYIGYLFYWRKIWVEEEVKVQVDKQEQ